MTTPLMLVKTNCKQLKKKPYPMLMVLVVKLLK
jgi:hypothetical protein